MPSYFGTIHLDQIAEYRLNFSVLFGVMRQKLYQVLIAPKSFQALFDRASICAKVKYNQGSRDKVVNAIMSLGGFANGGS